MKDKKIGKWLLNFNAGGFRANWDYVVAKNEKNIKPLPDSPNKNEVEAYVPSHTSEILNPTSRKKAAQVAIEKIQQVAKHFSHIAVCGYSGSVIGSIVANHFGKQLAIVRKEGEGQIRRAGRNELDVLDFHECTKYLIIDDIVASGKTVERIVSKLGKSKLYGIYLYLDGCQEFKLDCVFPSSKEFITFHELKKDLNKC